VAELVQLDGSHGGGQLLRSALSLSLVTGRPFRLSRLRARRNPPGLRPQHLACIRGALALAEGSAEGAEVGSPEVRFHPGPVRPGDYLLDVATAGSTPLVLQCLAYPLALAGGGTLTLRGGTHVPHSPCYHYLSWVWRSAVQLLGLNVTLALRTAGFYPEGAGELRAQVAGWSQGPELLELPARGTLTQAVVTSLFGGVPFAVAQRQGAAAVQALREHGMLCEEEHLPLPTTRSAGSTVFVRLQFEHTVAGFTVLSERSAVPEEVGRKAAALAAAFMEGGGAVDEHLADQLVLPAALLAAGRAGPRGLTRFRSAKVTDHLLHHAKLVEDFLPVRVQVTPEGGVEVAAT
jgi:RNA 3'-terminal phosphate cyclase (ATP)